MRLKSMLIPTLIMSIAMAIGYNPIAAKTKKAMSVESAPLEQIVLIEVQSYSNGPAAVVVLPDGGRALLKEGDPIGNQGGKVTRILEDRIMVEERQVDQDAPDRVFLVERSLPLLAVMSRDQTIYIDAPVDPGKWKGEPINVDLINQDLIEALRSLSNRRRFHFIASHEVAGKVTMKAENIPWDQALDLILVNTGHAYVKKGPIAVIASKYRLDPEKNPPNFKDHYSGYALSFDFRDMELSQALKIIADVSNKNIIIDPKVEAKVSIKADSVPWDMLLDNLVYLTGLATARQDNVIIVAPQATLAREWKPVLGGTYSGERMDLILRDQPVSQALESIAQVSGKKLEINNANGGIISISLKKVPWDLALDIIVAGQGLAMSETEEMIKVTFPDKE
jgi:type II secretory pathway component HofQ